MDQLLHPTNTGVRMTEKCCTVTGTKKPKAVVRVMSCFHWGCHRHHLLKPHSPETDSPKPCCFQDLDDLTYRQTNSSFKPQADPQKLLKIIIQLSRALRKYTSFSTGLSTFLSNVTVVKSSHQISQVRMEKKSTLPGTWNCTWLAEQQNKADPGLYSWSSCRLNILCVKSYYLSIDLLELFHHPYFIKSLCSAYVQH